MDDKKPDNMDEFDEEMTRGEFKEPIAHFDDDMEYLSEEKGTSKGMRSRAFNFPRFSIGWLGGLLLLLILLFLFLPRNNKSTNDEELIVLKSRIEELEKQQQNLNAANLRLEKLEFESGKGPQLIERMDKLESLLISGVDDLRKEMEVLKSGIENEKAARIAASKKSEEPKTVKAVQKTPVKTEAVKKPAVTSNTAKYHTVKAGENLFRIALTYKLNEDELLKLNGMQKGAVIHPGQRLRVSR